MYQEGFIRSSKRLGEDVQQQFDSREGEKKKAKKEVMHEFSDNDELEQGSSIESERIGPTRSFASFQ